ncbi:MAG: hypothetical protein ACJA0E_001178 [Bermanella sp.]|jgi:uncharacterized protein YcbX
MYSVSQLFYYPIKSLGAVETSQFSNGPCGPLLDRRIMLIDVNDKFITQRQVPLMSLIQVNDLGTSLSLSFGSETITLPWPDFCLKTESILVNVWEDKVSAQLFSPDVSNWLSGILNKQTRLVYMDSSEHRQVDLEFTDVGVQTGFSDGFPFLLISQASIDFLSEKVGYELSVKRFRPNIVIKGCEPFEEDSWLKITIGGTHFDLVKPCSRCIIPTINLQTAEKERAVMQAMLDYRKINKNVYVGQNLVYSSGLKQSGLLEVGNVLKVLD